MMKIRDTIVYCVTQVVANIIFLFSSFITVAYVAYKNHCGRSTYQIAKVSVQF